MDKLTTIKSIIVVAEVSSSRGNCGITIGVKVIKENEKTMNRMGIELYWDTNFLFEV